jgi:ABC-2 type transport system ATP-binding protein
MNAVTVTGVGRRYGRTWAVRDCTFTVHAGRVVALVGHNAAGKSTLLGMLAGQIRPSTGSLSTAEVRIVTQAKPTYGIMTAAQMLEFGRRFNDAWDHPRALGWLETFKVPLNRRCDRLSGGQRTQVALALAVGARPRVLLLDEPLAELDPVVRGQVMGRLLELVATDGTTVVLSTHVVTDLRGVADTLLVMADGGLVLAGDVDELLAEHRYLEGPAAAAPPGGGQVIRSVHDGRRSRFLTRGTGPALLHPSWTARPIALEDLVLDYLQADAAQEAAS